MKIILKAIGIFCAVMLAGCEHTNNKKVEASKNNTQVESKISPDKKSDKASSQQTHKNLYSEGETRRDFLLSLWDDPSTKKKVYTEKSGDDSLSITLAYQKKRIICIVYRVINKNISSKKTIFNSVFDFDEKNNCIYSNEWNVKEKMTYTYDMSYGTLIKYDVYYNEIDIDATQKRNVIQSKKAFLDSIMKHFPEFKYSFNWK